MANSRLILASIALFFFVSSVVSHSYVTSPTTRSNQRQTNSGCRGPTCLGPCDVPLNSARTPAVAIARGANIQVKWPRNNHAGGFIRFAWSPTDQSDSHASFDANVQEIRCHEIGGCGPDNANDKNGGDSGPADGSSRACQASITVPSHLTDGKWTLQWAWFGGAFALGDYYSCIDYVISGGQSGSKLDATFIGGDYTYPNQNKCKFFNTDRLHQCTNEICDKPVFPLYQEQSGPAYGFSANTPNTKPLTTSAPARPLTTSTPARPLTTSSKRPLTTSSVKPITSGKVNLPATTSRISLTTGTKVVDYSGVKNCASLTKEISSVQATITAVDTWSNVFRMEIRLAANENVADWMMQVIWPADAIDTEVENAYSGGILKCSATSPSRHSMIAPAAEWANQIKSGEELYIEIRGTNTQMSSQFIKDNTKIRIFKK